jgi:hypothetical protein
MPLVLLRAHQLLDRAVDAAYGRRDLKPEAERVAFLFELSQRYAAQSPPTVNRSAKRSLRPPSPDA